MAVAAIAIVINAIGAWLFAANRHSDLNARGAFMHLLTDAMVSFAVMCAGGLIAVTGWLWLDPVVTLIVVGVIVLGTWDLLKGSLQMTLAAVPDGIDPGEVRKFLSEQPGVTRVHDLHIWPLSTTQTALSCHLVMPVGHPGDEFTARITDSLHRQFNIEHATVQIELAEEPGCRLSRDDVI